MDCKFEVELMYSMLTNRSRCCKQYLSCDLCPFGLDEDNSDVYKCAYEQPIRNIIESIFCEVDIDE